MKKVASKEADAVALFKLLADVNRFRTITLLAKSKKALSVGEIAEASGMNHSATSHQLARLHDKGIVQYKRNGREVRYALANTPMAKQVVKVMKLV